MHDTRVGALRVRLHPQELASNHSFSHPAPLTLRYLTFLHRTTLVLATATTCYRSGAYSSVKVSLQPVSDAPRLLISRLALPAYVDPLRSTFLEQDGADVLAAQGGTQDLPYTGYVRVRDALSLP